MGGGERFKVKAWIDRMNWIQCKEGRNKAQREKEEKARVRTRAGCLAASRSVCGHVAGAL